MSVRAIGDVTRFRQLTMEIPMIRYMIMTLLASSFVFILGCETNQGTAKRQRVESREGDKSWRLSSDNLVESTDAAVAGIAGLSNLVRGEDGRAVIVLDRVENRTTDQSTDFQIHLARIRAMLNQSGAKENLVFIETRYKAEGIRQREGIPDSATQRTRPRYALTATFSDLPRRKGVFYLLAFQLVDLTNDIIAWEDSYEVRL